MQPPSPPPSLPPSPCALEASSLFETKLGRLPYETFRSVLIGGRGVGGCTPAAADVKHTLAQVKVFLKSSLYSLDAKPLLRIALSAFFESSAGFVDAVVQHLPSPIAGAARRVSRCARAMRHRGSFVSFE